MGNDLGIRWSSRMRENYEILITCLPEQVRNYVGKNIQKEIQRSVTMRGIDEVDTSALVNSFILNTPVFFRGNLELKIQKLGMNPKDYEKDIPKRDLVALKEDIALTCRGANLPYDEESVNQIIDIFGEQFAYIMALVSFRSTTKSKKSLSYRFVNLFLDYNPYQMVLEHNLVNKETGHAIHNFIKEVLAKERIQGYGMDFGAASGFEKIWIYFPLMVKHDVNQFAMLEYAPKSIAANLDFFERYGIKDYYINGLDFTSNSTNLYFPANRIPKLNNELVKRMLTELGMTEWTERIIELCTKAAIVYFTFTWDSLTIERVCFAITEEDISKIPYDLDPFIKKYVDVAPTVGDDKKFIYGLTFGKNLHYVKIENDYSDSMVDCLKELHKE